MTPCPDCAHTDNPGWYVGFAFERSPCQTCGGSATVGIRAYDAERVELSFGGVTLRPGQTVVGIDPGHGQDRYVAARGHIEAGHLVIETCFEFKRD